MSAELCLQPVLARILIIKFWGVWIPKTVWQLWPWSHLRAVQVLRYYCDAWTVVWLYVHSVLYSYNTAFMWEQYDFDDEYIKSAAGTASQSSELSAVCCTYYILLSLSVCVCVVLCVCHDVTIIQLSSVLSFIATCWKTLYQLRRQSSSVFHRQPDSAVWILVLSGRHPFPGCRLYKMTLDGCCFFTFILCYSAFRFIGKFLLVVLLQRAAMLALQALY